MTFVVIGAAPIQTEEPRLAVVKEGISANKEDGAELVKGSVFSLEPNAHKRKIYPRNQPNGSAGPQEGERGGQIWDFWAVKANALFAGGASDLGDAVDDAIDFLQGPPAPHGTQSRGGGIPWP